MLFEALALNEELSGRESQRSRHQLFNWWRNWLLQHTPATDANERLLQLIDLVYHELAFSGNWKDFFNSQNVYLDTMIEQRLGTSASLALLVSYFAHKLDLPCDVINLPGCFVLRFILDDDCYFDPFTGEQLTLREVELKLRGYKGDLARLTGDHLRALEQPEVMVRWLSALKSALIREDQFEGALRVSETLLQFNPDDPHEMRDRGFLFQQLDCANVAIHDYEYFIEKCPRDPVADLLKIQIRSLEQEPSTLH
ncbi:SirB1 family protein [Celerinatantimonas yamalensis]|uniref:Tetratricopeptide repeat protein n=1 Tax=Celerinatantimonas yamalensis TaxID=559956 RepID=A0ABW9G6F7_9GAMM